MLSIKVILLVVPLHYTSHLPLALLLLSSFLTSQIKFPNKYLNSVLTPLLESSISSSPLINLVKFVVNMFHLFPGTSLLVDVEVVGGDIVDDDGLSTAFLEDGGSYAAPLEILSLRLSVPCSLASTFGSYMQLFPGVLVVIPAPAFLIRSLSNDVE